METAVLGGGCFWCTEAVFLSLAGVTDVKPGYCGGHIENPTYEQVCDGDTGHIEVVKVTFNPEVVSYETLLEVFFATHDPTTPGRQGHDVGPQYQSAIFVSGEQQRAVALETIDRLTREQVFSGPICTLVLPEGEFWVAEPYHHNYFANHPGQGYCQMVISPKIMKFKKNFSALLARSV